MIGLKTNPGLKSSDKPLWKRMRHCWQLYVLALPTIICITMKPKPSG